MVGLSRFELLTPRLSSVCSNQLSYRPVSVCAFVASDAYPSTRFSKRLQTSPNVAKTTEFSKIQEPQPLVPSKLDRAYDPTNLLSTRSIVECLSFYASGSPSTPSESITLERR